MWTKIRWFEFVALLVELNYRKKIKFTAKSGANAPLGEAKKGVVYSANQKVCICLSMRE